MVGDIAHICNRGVEKRKIFLDHQDYSRFRDNLFLINNINGRVQTRRNDIRELENIKREKLIEILKWSLLPNHYHLLVYEVTDGGISEFTKRIGNAYTKYFNIKNNGRSGYLFQNKAQIIPIQEESQFLYIPFYVDMNPLDVLLPNWKDKRPSNKHGIELLKGYKWSSFRDYFADGHYNQIINIHLFHSLFDTDVERYESELGEFIQSADVSTWHVDTGVRGI